MANQETLDALQQMADAGELGITLSADIVNFTAPEAVERGAQLNIFWTTRNAVRVVLDVTGSIQTRVEVPLVGAWSAAAIAPGLIRAQLTVFGEQDGFENCSLAEQVRQIEVVVPPVQLALRRTVLYAPPGQIVRVHWTSTHAARVLVRRPRFEEQLDAPPCGEVDVEMDATDDSIEIIAFSHDGETESRKVCRLMAVLDEDPDVDRALEWLNRA